MGVFTRTVGYAYPWDLNGDPAAADRLVDVGLTDVAIAAVYHGVRAATPHHPAHRLVEATAASYVPVDPVDWSDAALAPDDAGSWAGANAFGRAKRSAQAAGLGVRAWTVLTHNSVIGSRRPDVVVRNAFGDHYSHALCPAVGEVHDYAVRLTTATVRGGEVEDVVFEAVGQLGVEHQSAHEKTSGADWTADQRVLLSVCFCASSQRAMTEAGLNPDESAATVRDAVADSETAAEAVESAWFGELVRLRTAAADALHADALSAALGAGATRTALHATPDPSATGPASAITPATARSGSDAVVPAWDLGPDAVARVDASRLLLPDSVIGAYSTVLDGRPDPVLFTDAWRDLAHAGAAELHLYHVGLASSARLDAARTALTTLSKETA